MIVATPLPGSISKLLAVPESAVYETAPRKPCKGRFPVSKSV